MTPPQAILSHLHKKPPPEPQSGVKTVLTSALFLWHCRFCFETDREMEILMPKAEWGVKRTCLGCGARFYDLKRDPIVCPKCDAEFDITVAQKPKRARPAAAAKVAAKAAAKAAVKKADDLIDDTNVDLDADADADADTDNAGDDAVLESDDDDGDVIVAKGAGDDDDSESIDEDVLLDAADDDAADNDKDGDEDGEGIGDAKAAKTGGGKPKDS